MPQQNERRKLLNVKDKSTEVVVLVNNILTFLVLGVMAWVGTNINTMKTDMATIKEHSVVNRVLFEGLEKRLEAHIYNHWTKHREGK